MIRSTRMLALAAALVAALLFASVAHPPGGFDRQGRRRPPTTVMTLNFRGTAQREPSASDRYVYTTDLYSLATGEKVGTATQNAGFTEKPGVLDYVVTLHLRDGELVGHQKKNFAPDADHSGFLIYVKQILTSLGGVPEKNTCLAAP